MGFYVDFYQIRLKAVSDCSGKDYDEPFDILVSPAQVGNRRLVDVSCMVEDMVDSYADKLTEAGVAVTAEVKGQVLLPDATGTLKYQLVRDSYVWEQLQGLVKSYLDYCIEWGKVQEPPF